MKRAGLYLSCVALLGVSLSITGCDSGGDAGGSDMDALAAQLERNKKVEADAAAAEQAKAEADKKAADEVAARQAALDAAKAERAATEAAAPAEGGTTTAGGATVGEGGGYYSAIVGAHRHITTRVDDLAWTQALQHYKAETGEMPKDHAEFMRVMAEKGIPLPELEQGQELLWDPSEGDWGTLYIVEPNPQPANPQP